MTFDDLPKSTIQTNREYLKLYGINDKLDVLYYIIEGSALFIIDINHYVSLYNITNGNVSIKPMDFVLFADKLKYAGIGYIYFTANKKCKYDFIAKLVDKYYKDTMFFVKNSEKDRWELHFYSDFYYVAKRRLAKKDISDACPLKLIQALSNLISIISEVALTPTHPARVEQAIAHAEKYIDSFKAKTGLSTDFYF